ncbi:hypothetical protein ASG93_21385 [Paenibacillus sp. Soil787]|nr:hypothetical protein ASG93_21385 [Paenibacillus sp. Soil787]
MTKDFPKYSFTKHEPLSLTRGAEAEDPTQVFKKDPPLTTRLHIAARRRIAATILKFMYNCRLGGEFHD